MGDDFLRSHMIIYVEKESVSKISSLDIIEAYDAGGRSSPHILPSLIRTPSVDEECNSNFFSNKLVVARKNSHTLIVYHILLVLACKSNMTT
jgi:hypothetical protein